jgi:hypothetical protein
MKRARGIYRPTYRDKATGELKAAALWWIRYHHNGKLYRESSGSPNQKVAEKLLRHRLGEIDRTGHVIGPVVEKTTLADLCAMLEND